MSGVERMRPAGSGPRLRQKIAALGPWFHNLHLPGDVQTAPDHFLGDFPACKWHEIGPRLPADLSGWSVLDIGCNAGYYSFELARRNADVLAIDMNETYLAQARWAAGVFGLSRRVRFRRMQVYELARSEETFDLVLFMGVFYHLRYPLLGLDIVARKVRRRMVFQTLTMPGAEVLENTEDRDIDDRADLLQPGWPKMAFFEHRFARDRTNWWAPNHAAVEAMLRSSGLRVIERPGTEVYICAPDPEGPSSSITWNADEYLAAAGRAPRHRRVGGTGRGAAAKRTPAASSG
jgi:tRNA (mo5U34)-methyltransferase